jgi:F-box protein 9
VILEQRGELEEALVLYRSAFRREPNVDILYEREEMLGTILAQQFASSSSPTGEIFDSHFPRPKVVLAGDGFTMEDLSRKLEKTLAAQDMKSHVGNRADKGVVASRSLVSVLSTFPQNLVFQPEDENEVSPFNLVPDEIIISIMKILDPSSLERFASVNRKARVVSLDITIWM